MLRWALRGVTVSAALAVLAGACAQGQDGIDVGDAAALDPDADPGDSRAPSRDGSTPSSDGSKPDPEDDAGKTCTGKVVINELQPDGPAGAEFIELYNPNDCAVPLGNWKLLYRASNNNPGLGLHSFAVGDSIPAKVFLVFGNAKFAGKKDGDFVVGAGMGKSGGQVGLVNDQGKVVDAVGYGTGTTGTYTEKSAAPLPPSSGSVGRKSDGVDTDDNNADFKTFATPSAGAAN